MKQTKGGSEATKQGPDINKFNKMVKDVSREFDEIRVNAHLCKLRCWYL